MATVIVPATPPVRVPAQRLTGCVMENSNPSHSWSCAMETWLHASKGGCHGAVRTSHGHHGQPALPGARQAVGPGPVPRAARGLYPFGVLGS